MDVWGSEAHHHKRSFTEFTEMSHPATLSPSPVTFGEPAANFFSSSRFPRAPSHEGFASLFERRRTSHPHNHSYQRASEEMPERSQSQQRPRLEHRASQTIIDLTDDTEDAPVPARAPLQRPPQLGRSDAVNLRDFIDLTDDNGDQDIIITGGRSLPLPRPSVVPPHRGYSPSQWQSPPSPSLFMPPAPEPQRVNRVFPAHHHSQGIGLAIGGAIGRAIGRAAGARIPAEAQFNHNMAAQMGQQIMDHMERIQGDQAMPGPMNYQHHAFVDRKPQHVAPPPAKEGFTRSPDESQTIICPSCEEELIHKKDEEPLVKKGGKAPTRKEREEHPFWVLKECGHTYCNSCYQHRMLSGKHGAVSFREISKSSSSKSKSTKNFACAVDECESEIRSKDKWVGVFL